MARKKSSSRPERVELFAEDGTPFDEAASTLIKHLRRGEAGEALYWCKNMQKRFPKYVWRRLAIFAAEDVSIANPQAIQNVVGLWETHDEGSYNGIVEAVVLLADSPKCRESNLLWAAKTELKKVPEGKTIDTPRFGENVDYWADALEKALMENEEFLASHFVEGLHKAATFEVVWDVIRRVAARKALDGFDEQLVPTVDALYRAYVKIIRANKDRPDLDVVSMATLMVSRSSIVDTDDVREKANVGKLEVPEYALDGHTRRGKKLHPVPRERHLMWFTEWSKVEPNVGPNDWELWHLRRMAQDGMGDQEAVEQQAEEWHAEGRLVFGLDGPLPYNDWKHRP